MDFKVNKVMAAAVKKEPLSDEDSNQQETNSLSDMLEKSDEDLCDQVMNECDDENQNVTKPSVSKLMELCTSDGNYIKKENPDWKYTSENTSMETDNQNTSSADSPEMNSSEVSVTSKQENEEMNVTLQSNIDIPCNLEPKPFPRRRRRWKREIYDKNGDPESIKMQRKKRAVELKLKNLSWTLNQPAEVSGKRKKKAPERFELALLSKRRTAMDNVEGDGELLGDIPWIVQQVRVANIYILRLLHRVIFRRQGMFSEKHIRKSVLSFRGFPFDFDSVEVKKRKYPLEKASPTSLGRLCDILGVKSGPKEQMIDNILRFLTLPTKQQVEDYVKEMMNAKLQQAQQQKLNTSNVSTNNCISPKTVAPMLTGPCPVPLALNMALDCSKPSNSSYLAEEECIITGPWEKPQFFVEGTGIKLKFIKPIVTSLQVVTDSLIELLHRILFLNGDEKANMRRNILEFSGFRCIVGSNDYVLRTKLLAVLPLDQLKFICRVLGLPTWHRSRQLLIETIMDFLAAPRLSAMKKRVTPPLPNTVCALTHLQMANPSPEPKAVETEEIEIVPDIHISDEEFDISQRDCSMENMDEKDVKLKHFQNIHFQVISTPAGKLNDLHMILFLKPCPLTTVRKNILEFSRFTFDDQSAEYQCRQALMEHMFLENLKRIASILCLSQYIVDQSRANIIQAVLRFLLKPSVLFNPCSMLPSSPETPEAKKLSENKEGMEVTKEACDNPVAKSAETDDKCAPICTIVKVEHVEMPEEDNSTKQASDTRPDVPKAVSDATTKESSPNVPVPEFEKHLSSRKTSTPRKSLKPRKVSSELVDGKTSIHPVMAEMSKILQNGDLDEPLSLVKKKTIRSMSNHRRGRPRKRGRVFRNVTEQRHSRSKFFAHYYKSLRDPLPFEEGPAPLNNIDRVDDQTAINHGSFQDAVSVSSFETRLESDEDDQPLARFIGHPNDDQIKILISKVMKESKLEELTMKQLIKTVFSTYPHFDLGYRREFIKSVVRQILSQMDQSSCSVSTTVLTF